jgi:tRNA U34 5-methylaminomethyl-2-thiouridine-forming methyltransferase MnmC
LKYKRKIILTADGSHSIELVDMNEHYHSVHGAIQESQHVFIEYGLKQIAEFKNEISILEIGMGTGLNVLLTYIFGVESNYKVKYLALEPYPIQEDTWQQLNYTHQLKLPDLQNNFELLHSSEWDEQNTLSESFIFEKQQKSILDIRFDQKFDLVYFDAFNPDLEPFLWSESVFKKIYQSMSKDGLLTTYSTKGIVKRAMKSCGFSIKKQPGPEGKREILNGWKRNQIQPK